MTLQPVLANPQYTRLREPSYAGDSYVTLFSDRVVFKCLINTDLTASGSWAQFNYNTVTIGAYTDVFVGQEVFISATGDIKDSTFLGRVRLAPSSSVMYVNESSLNFSIGATVFVVDNHVPMYRLSRPSTNDPATAVELVDYDQTFQQLAPQTVGIKTAYIGNVNTSGKFRIAIDANDSYAGTSGATISSFLWTIDGTYIAGNSSASRIIVDVTAGEQWGSLLLTDSGGRTSLRWFAIRAHSDDDPPNVYGSNISITGNYDQGWTASVPFFAGVDDVLPNAFAIVWRDYEAYGGYDGNLWGGSIAAITGKVRSTNVVTLTASNTFQAGQQVIVISDDSSFNGTFVITAATSTTFSYAQTGSNVGSTGASGTAHVNAQNVEFIGWWQQEDDPATMDADAGVLETANFQFTGIGARMQRMTSQLLGFSLDSSPTLWGEMVNMTPQRAMLHFLQRYTTIADICDIAFFSFDNTYVFPSLSAQGGNAMESVRGIARQINANPEFAPWGAVQIVREVGQLSSVERAALPTIASWDMQDIISPGGISRSIEPIQSVGKVDADGGGYNTTLQQVIVYTARAPGTAQGEGSGSETLPAQILPASATSADTLDILRQRVGNQLLIVNNQEYLNVDHPDGYVGVPFIPSKAQLYTWTLDVDMVGANNVNRIVYTTSATWTVENVAINYSSEGLRTVKVTYHRVTPIGALGDDTTIVVPAPGEIPPLPDPGIPGFDFDPIEILYPDDPVPGTPPPLPDGNIATFKGQELIVTSPTQAWWLKNVITLASPTALNITPPDLGDFAISQPLISPFYTSTAIPGYVSATDGVDTKVYYAPNVATLGPAWTAGASFSGIYQVMRASLTDGTVLVYSPNSTISTTTYDFTTGQQGWVASADLGANYIAGQGWSYVDALAGLSYYRGAEIELAISSSTVVGVSFTYNYVKGSTGSGFTVTDIELDASVVKSTLWNDEFTGTNKVYTWFGSQASVTRVAVTSRSSANAAAVYSGSVLITSATVYLATGTAGGIRVSTDYGATFGSQLPIGSAPGAFGGFDVQRSAENSFAASLDEVYRATTIGGAYTSYYSITGGSAQAACVVVPFFDWNGNKQTTATNPDILVGLTALDGSSRSLLWIDGGATPGTVRNLTPVANFLFGNPNSITVDYNHHIMVFGTVSGVPKCYRTTDKGSTWSEVTGRTAPTFIRGRRNDNTAKTIGTNKGQVYLCDNGTIGYSSKWASLGFSNRNVPDSAINAFDTVY